MDSAAIFRALHDTRCLKFGSFELKSGKVAPYYMNLRRLSLYPKLMNAIVSLTVERFLTREHDLNNKQQQLTTIQSNPQNNSDNNRTKPIQPNVSSNSLESGNSMDFYSDDADSQLDESDELSEELNVVIKQLNDDFDQSTTRPLDSDLDPILCAVPYGAIPLASAIAAKARLPLLFERKEQKAYGDTGCLMNDFTPLTRSGSREQQPREGHPSRQRVILIEDVVCSGESILDTIQSLAKRRLQVEFVICIVDREEDGLRLLLEEAGVRVLPLFKIRSILRVLEQSGRITSEQFERTDKWISENKFSQINGYTKKVKELSKQSRLAKYETLVKL